MTEQELRTLMRGVFNEKITPIVQQMTELICNAYVTGFNTGLETGMKLEKKSI